MMDKITKVMELLEQAKLLITEIENDVYAVNQVFTLPISSLDLKTNKSHQTRFESACMAFNINTIGDLVKYGSPRFLRLRNIGSTIVSEVKVALKQQYNIEW